ncbi:hypothetical protein LCGC14_2331940 [marine sediment metagenome]|uniref:Uncharacterized protein n=1 Tax=marine sediment metagenome TaxID=412755 RepID=A0A0F9CFD4_9ZZZZ
MRRGIGAESVRVEEIFTADENDVLRDTDLSQAPGPGVIGIWAASDQADHLCSVRIGGSALLTNQLVPFRGTSAPIQEEQQAPIASKQVNRGDTIKVDIDIVTPGDTRIMAMWLGKRF